MKKKLKIPIGFKLVSITALILISATLTVVYVATDLFIRDNTAFFQKNTSDLASQLAKQTNEYFQNLVHTMITITEIQVQGLSTQKREMSIKQQFNRNKEVLSVTSWRKGATQPENADYSSQGQDFKSVISKYKPSDKVWNGELDVGRVTINGRGLIAISFPLVVDEKKNVVKGTIGLIDESKLVEIYGKAGEIPDGKKEEVSGKFTSYLVDKDGNVLAHPNAKFMTEGANFRSVEIVRDMLESTFNNSQKTFKDRDGRVYLGAFRKTGIGGSGVISQVLEEASFATAKRVRYRASLVAGIILFLSFSFIFFFSKTLTKPIQSLVALTREIANGNFKVNIKPKGRDEITELTKSFGQMATGLAERDKLKETFNKFHSKEIAEAILKGEIKLGGTRQKATVFFSDIRGFTGLSEELTAEQVVEMLNEYMTAMVGEILSHKGVVDKYVGDAIMAVWGAPIPKPDDTWNAVRACLAMRKRLEKFNQDRISKGKKPVKMGMGLHTGDLIAGNIGSTEKMEYTVIGDTVNTASRIESMTKEFGTDLLISDDIFQQLKDRLIVEPVTASVKGKSKALQAYKVKGYYDENKNPIIVETKYSSYEAEHSEKVKAS